MKHYASTKSYYVTCSLQLFWLHWMPYKHLLFLEIVWDLLSREIIIYSCYKEGKNVLILCHVISLVIFGCNILWKCDREENKPVLWLAVLNPIHCGPKSLYFTHGWLHLHAPCQLSAPVSSKAVNLSKAKAPLLIAEVKSFLTCLPSAAALASSGLTPSAPLKLLLQRVSPLLSLCSAKPWEKGRSFCADLTKAWFQPSLCDGVGCSCAWPICRNM